MLINQLLFLNSRGINLPFRRNDNTLLLQDATNPVLCRWRIGVWFQKEEGGIGGQRRRGIAGILSVYYKRAMITWKQ